MKNLLPNKIKIGYQNIAVKRWDFEDAEGVYLSDRHEIRIQEGLEGCELLNTVIHECLHAAVFTYGLKKDFKDDDHEEKVVNTLANALTQILTGNPRLMKWIASSV